MSRSISNTKLDILETLKRRRVMTVDQIVQCFDLSKTAVRAHLVRLEEDALIEREEVPSEGRGRPPLTYRVTERGAQEFSTEDSLVLTRLLNFLDRRGEGAMIDEFFDELWSERLEEVRAALDTESLDSASREERIEVLEELLSLHDFMPEVEAQTCSNGATKITVRECNCPFPAAVRATRKPCQRETEFLAEVLGSRPIRTSFASNRSETCVFDFLADEP